MTGTNLVTLQTAHHLATQSELEQSIADLNKRNRQTTTRIDNVDLVDMEPMRQKGYKPSHGSLVSFNPREHALRGTIAAAVLLAATFSVAAYMKKTPFVKNALVTVEKAPVSKYAFPPAFRR